MDNSNKFVSGLLLVWDVITLSLTFLLSISLFKENSFQVMDWLVFFGLTTLWFVIVLSRKLYLSDMGQDVSSRIVNFLKSCIILIVLFGLTYLIFTFPPNFRNAVIAFSIGFPLLGVTTNFIIISLINRWGNNGNRHKDVLVTGMGNMVNQVNHYFNGHPNLGYNIKGFVKYSEKSTDNDAQYVSDISHIGDYMNENHVDEIIVALPIKCSKKIKSILKTADYHGARVRFIPDYKEVLGEDYKVIRHGKIDMINARQMPLDNKLSNFIKECFDWCFSSLALLFLAPLFLIIAILIKMDSTGPVFYCPVRIGKAGRPFRVFKFRTMVTNDNAGISSTQFNDPRITRVGKILRKYSIDELPQFANVFFGEMSVVGPRPHRSYLNQQFQKAVDKYMVRHYFKPGITGWAQVNGWRGPTETQEQKQQRFRHDLWYLENWSLWLDIRIIWLTIFGKKTHSKAF
ncbi:undecaprenyl-phosphate glucose phosphotransferase [Echinicola jeungdonensis]|uniref:Undecaprenyl-phosphate glucose phosphotransferase n=1 Tax=Echinicola jeungdonensis TaxID=709343 RepID=A0ABV5J1Z7_9BACT|nr:undecaprenyl-phosphate glucose phosphotransferase [Echinicola jeungdonensis]MDN3671170.1 undecaprenyl-phosphate glucose phosphotransferase [Echinicola jeungdonensis]